jgi:hypothetical protein
MRKTLAVFGMIVLFFAVTGFAQGDDEEVTQEQIDKLKAEIEELEARVMKNERKKALDRIDFTGDFRFEAHSIDASFNDYFDGMQLQRLLVDTLFYFNATGMPPASPDDVGNLIRDNYADYLFYLNNVVSFDWLRETLGQFPPEMQQALLGGLLPFTYQTGYDYSNDIIYTNRLRLNIHADVGKKVNFDGRLSMYKVFGDSAGVQVFNGQPTSINTDGTTASVPNSDVVHVERAYFNWMGPKFYLSIGRRPSTGGAPLNLRNDEPRGGSPLGSVINYQFDGITVGWYLHENSTMRVCYGIGYESGFGNGDLLKRPQDRLDDAWFIGLNWDIWNTDDMFIQTTFARATDITDGFNGLVVLPVDPVSGQPVPAPAILRYTPSATVGNIDWASLVLMRSDGPLDWFASVNYMESDPNNVSTPFGGLFSDPFDTPQARDGHMYYLGARYNLPNEKTKIGLEFNHGSEYWFNMAVAEDDLFAPKTAARGDVWELYMTHRIRQKFIFKLDYIHYDYDYSGSGWHLGAPKDLSSTPILGFQTPSDVDKYMLSFLAKF